MTGSPLRVALATPLAALALTSAAGAEAGDPVRLTVSVAAVASLDRPVPLRVTVESDRDAFRMTAQPVRVRVRLTPGVCGSTFATTPGAVLIDRRLGVVPTTSAPYSETVRGTGRASAYGVQTVCAYVEEQTDDRLYAADGSSTVDVSRPCTLAGRGRERAARAFNGARRRLARTRAGATRRRLAAAVRRRGARLQAASRAEGRACSSRA